MSRIQTIEKELTKWAEDTSECKKSQKWSRLAKKTGYTYSWIRRVARGEANPSFGFEKDVLSVIHKNDLEPVYDYLLEKYPDQATLIETARSQLKEAAEFTNDKLRDVVEDEKMYRVYRLSSPCKYTISQMSEVCEFDARSRVIALMELGLVEIKGDVVCRKDAGKTFINTDFAVSAECAINNLGIMKSKDRERKLTNEDSLDQKQNRLISSYESVNEAALEKAVQVQIEAHNKIRELLIKPESKGDIPVFLTNAIGRLDEN